MLYSFNRGLMAERRAQNESLKAHADSRLAQSREPSSEPKKMGHDTLFDNYRISVGEIKREYTKDNRDEAPADSNAYIID